jgi:hypothetical protein
LLGLLLRQFDHYGALCCGSSRHLSLEIGKALLKLLPFLFQLLFGFSGKFKCGSKVVVGASGGSLSLLTLPGMFGNQVPGSGDLVLCGDQRFAQAFKFCTQFTFRLMRVGRGTNAPALKCLSPPKDL